jgi:predicted GH43/DUF377 family glycosyl hydrolase
MSSRNVSWLALCACLALLSILTISLTVVALEPDDIVTVCPPPGTGCGYTVIQEAIDNAIPGDTIRVAQGIYTENLTIDKQLTLEGGYESSGWTRGVAMHETIIDGSNSRNVMGDWDGSAVARPSVISDGAEYKMWFDGANLSWDVAIGLSTSSDGISWTKHPANPVLTGTAGMWDGDSDEHTPFVLKEDGVYKMWYEGGDGDVRQLGYATSTNGIDWSKHPGNPVVEAGPEGYDQDTAGHGSVVKDAGSYELWYHAQGDQGALIARATSPDGVDWTKHGPVLLPDPLSWDDDGLWGPSVLKVDGTYWIWYSACCWGDWTATGVATSTNGITWTRFLAAPVVTETGWVGDHHVISDGGRFKMWYHVWHDGIGDIAYAESDDGINWTKSASNPVLQPGTAGQWGQPVIKFVDGSDGSELDGFTVRNGEAQRGGGVLVDGSLVDIRNCTVMHNSAHEAGGGILLFEDSKAVVESNYILSNSVPSELGSGVCIDSSEVLLDSNLIAYNACTVWEHGNGAIGIAMEDLSLPVTVTNNVVVSNTDKGMMIAGGVHDLKVVNNTIASNRNEGILAWGTISVTSLSNNIIARQGYCGIAGAAGADFQSVDYNNVWGNGGGGGNYCDYSGSVNPPAPGPNDISTDPRFVDGAQGNYRLRFGSPCIDGGTPVGAPSTDIEGTARDALPDIGAYEWHGVAAYLPAVLKSYSVCAPLFADDFSDPGSGWSTGNNPVMSYQYLDGEYRILVKSALGGGWVYSPFAAPADYVLEASMRYASMVGGNGGLFFDAVDAGHHYYYALTTNGYYSLWKLSETNTALINWTVASGYNPYPQANRLGVVRHDGEIGLYLNGQFLASVSDSSYYGGAHVGLRAAGIGSPSVDVRFDDFEVRLAGCE